MANGHCNQRSTVGPSSARESSAPRLKGLLDICWGFAAVLFIVTLLNRTTIGMISVRFARCILLLGKGKNMVQWWVPGAMACMDGKRHHRLVKEGKTHMPCTECFNPQDPHPKLPMPNRQSWSMDFFSTCFEAHCVKASKILMYLGQPPGVNT